MLGPSFSFPQDNLTLIIFFRQSWIFETMWLVKDIKERTRRLTSMNFSLSNQELIFKGSENSKQRISTIQNGDESF